jgi:glycine cleavage system H protein
MEFDRTCRYQESHEWIRIEGNEAVIGISDYAQSELNDVVYVELPEVGDSLDQGEEFGSVESVKASSELYLPMSGEVIAINEQLEEEPELVNSGPFGNGWMVRIRLADEAEAEGLLDADGYMVALIEKMLEHSELDASTVGERVNLAPTPEERERWQAIWSMMQLRSAAQVAEALGRDVPTIAGWIGDFVQRGAAGLAPE